MKAPVGGPRRVRAAVLLAAMAATLTMTSILDTSAQAASSDFCVGGGYSLVNLSTGAVVASGDVDATDSGDLHRWLEVGEVGHVSPRFIGSRPVVRCCPLVAGDNDHPDGERTVDDGVTVGHRSQNTSISVVSGSQQRNVT